MKANKFKCDISYAKVGCHGVSIFDKQQSSSLLVDCGSVLLKMHEEKRVMSVPSRLEFLFKFTAIKPGQDWTCVCGQLL